jgi:electron transfer flavoprotein beta subunit
MKNHRIIVCAKQIPDPEVPLAAIRIDPVAKTFAVAGHTEVISPFDENALEAALRIKDEIGAEVIVLSLGGSSVSPSTLRKVLAVGADRLILLKDNEFDRLDSLSVASVIAGAVRKLGDFDLILTGRQAGDWDFGVTGVFLGEILGVPVISMARSVVIEDSKVVVKEGVQGGYRVVRAVMPALVTVSNEVGELRYPSMKDKLASARKPVTEWNAEDLEIDAGKLQKLRIAALVAPPDMSRKCRFIEEGPPEEMGEKLAEALFRDL